MVFGSGIAEVIGGPLFFLLFLTDDVGYWSAATSALYISKERWFESRSCSLCVRPATGGAVKDRVLRWRQASLSDEVEALSSSYKIYIQQLSSVTD